MTTVDNNKKALPFDISRGAKRHGERSDVNSVSAETRYHINRHVLYHLSPLGLSNFGVIDNPDKVVKKKNARYDLLFVKTLQKAWQYKNFCRF